MRVIAATLVFLLLIPLGVRAQKADTVFFEDLTFDEIRDLIRGGAKNVIVATGGTEDNGPHMVLGKHNFVVTYTADKIARTLGNTLVAPVIAYVPEGDWAPATGHMQKPGSISLPDDKGYTDLLEAAATGMKASGFKNIIFIGDSGGNQAGMKAVSEKLNATWKGTGVRILNIPDYYAKAHADQEKYITSKLGIPQADIGSHANIMDTSELMFINSKLVRLDKLEKGTPTNGVSGDPTKATPQLGQIFLQIKIDDALAQIKQLMAQGSN
jgi:creatinine amidohydrolase/Fe(II)-dependent formamide hydrolase-like protein